MAYTIISAKYANQNNAAAVLETSESGAVLASPERAELWGQFQQWLGSNSCAAYTQPAAGTPRHLLGTLHNYIFNGEGQLRTEATQAVLSDYALRSVSVTTAQNVSRPHALEVKNLENVAGHEWLCPGWGAGPGGGANFSFQSLDRVFADTSWPGNPERLLWLGWTKFPNPTPGSQGSGWETGSTRCDPSAWNDWRITILEHGLARGCEELLDSWVGYSFFARTGSPGTFTALPSMMTGYVDGEFFLHDLKKSVAVGPSVVEICGWFKVPNIPEGQIAIRGQFGIGFYVDTTTKEPPQVMFTGFKLCRWPLPTEPTLAPENIKYLVEKEPLSVHRQRAAQWLSERFEP